MIKLLRLDQISIQLRQLEMFDNIFQKFLNNPVRRYVKSVIYPNSSTSRPITEHIKILSSSNKSSFNSIKILIFFNMVANQITCKDQAHIEQALTAEISKIITLQKKRYEVIQKSRTRNKSSSLEKAASWLKQQFSKSKDKGNCSARIKRTSSCTQKLGRFQKTQIIQTTLQNLENNQQQSQVPTQGKQQVLINRVIIPYATYLLKLISAHINVAEWTKDQNLPNQNIWKVINALKSLCKISEGFPTLLRYYNKQCVSMIFTIIRMIDHDIKILSPILEKTLNVRGTQIINQINPLYQNPKPQKKKVHLFEELASKYQLTQFKQILYEISVINQSISMLYLGKYTYSEITREGLKKPALFPDSSKYEIVYDIINLIQKNKDTSKKQESSKNITRGACKFNKPLKVKEQISNQLNNLNNLSNKFGDKKLIIPNSARFIKKQQMPEYSEFEVSKMEIKTPSQIMTPSQKSNLH